MSAPKKSLRPKARPKKKKTNLEEKIDETVIDVLNEDLPPGVDYYGKDGKLSSPERDGETQMFRMGGEVRQGDVRDNAKRGKTY